MRTINQMSYQIKKMLSGNPSYNIEVRDEEIKMLVISSINEKLSLISAKNFGTSLDNFPIFSMIATYPSNTVVSYGQRSKCTMPVYPLTLPRNTGIWQIADINNPDILFIPLLSGQWGLSNNLSYLSNLSGVIGYETEGLNIIFTADITKLYPKAVNSVIIKEVVADISTLDGDDPLPITPEIELSVIDEIFSVLIHEPIYTHFNDGKDPRQNINLKSQ